MDAKQLKTLGSFDEIAEAAENLINEGNQNHPKYERTFTKKEAYEYLKCDKRTLERYVNELGINAKKYEGIDFMLDLSDVYRIREALPPSTILKSTIKPFKRTNKQRCQTIVVQNQKGGVAKTMTAITLATGLAVLYHQMYRVLIVDMDGQGTLSMYQPPEDLTQRRRTIGDLLKSDLNKSLSASDFEAQVRATVSDTTIPNMKILPADQKDREVEAEFHTALFSGSLDNPYNRLERILEVIKDDFDIIIIDTPPSYGFASLNAYRGATSVIFPMTATQNDLDATSNYFSYLPETYTAMLGSGHKGYDFIKILLTNFEETTSTLEVQGKMTMNFPTYMLSEVFKKSEAVRKCSLDKNSVFDISPSTFPGNKTMFKSAVINATSIVNSIHSEIYKVWQAQLQE